MPSFPVQQKTLSANYFHTSSQCLKKKKKSSETSGFKKAF